MFNDALLESSPVLRRRNAWPMATGFTLQMIFAALLVMLPLISTGVIPLTIHTIVPIPPRYTPIETPQPQVINGSHSGVTLPSHSVIQIANTHPLLPTWFRTPAPTDTSDQIGNPQLNIVGSPIGMGLPIDGRPLPPVHAVQRPIVSSAMDAMLINKVVPEYPQIARLAGVQGEVKLHAIIARDGTIQSLSVTSGPEMLREAALRAVTQWRYRPYILNGETVEVETVITVNFHRF